MRYISILLLTFSIFLFSPFTKTFSFAETASNCLETNIGNPPQNAPGGCGGGLVTSCNDPLSSVDQVSVPAIVSAVKTKYGINLSGDALTLGKAQLVYDDMCKLFQSPMYKKNLNSLTNNINVVITNAGTCFAWTTSGSDLKLEEPCIDIVDKYILVHELTHIMQVGETSLGRNAFTSVWDQVWATEENHKIPTGPCQLEGTSGVGLKGECEADAVAEYMFYEDYRNSWGDSPAPGAWITGVNGNYPTEWNKWYCFVQKNIFGGTTFYQNSPKCS